MADSTTFDPSRYLTKVNGSDYLEVKWRLVWLRDTHPDAVIDTDLIEHNAQHAVVRARVTLPSGASASGWGSEGLDDFANYIEKAETKALGRALAALGFGTQFCPDFEFGAANGHVVDAPVRTPSGNGRGAQQRQFVPIDQSATVRQRNLIQALSREARLGDKELDDLARSVTGRGADELSRRDASRLIEHFKERPAGVGAGGQRESA
jgi:hypothetical protein